MALNYIIQEMPNMREGKRVYYPKLEIYSQFDNEQMVDLIRQVSNLPASTIKAVLSALPEALKEALELGHTAKIEGLGTFSLSLAFCDDKGNELSEGKDEQAPQPNNKYRHVEVNRVNLKVAPELLNGLKRTECVRVQGDVNTLRHTSSTLQQRAERARKYVQSHERMYLDDYVRINNVCRTYASRELKMLSDDCENSGIEQRGHGSHKYWAKTRNI